MTIDEAGDHGFNGRSTELTELAERATDMFPDIDDAVEWMIAQIEENRDLRHSIERAVVNAAVRSYVYRVRHRDRTAVKAGKPWRTAESIAEGAEVVAASFLDGWLTADGRKLGDLTRADIEAEAVVNERLADGYRANAEFLRKCAGLCKDNKRLRQCAKEDRVKAIWDSVAG